MMVLPTQRFGSVATTTGYFEAPCPDVANWIGTSFGVDWETVRAGGRDLGSLIEPLAGQGPRDIILLMPNRSWTVMLTNGPLGTDLGLLPSRAAERRGWRALRAVDSRGDSPGVILALYEPTATDHWARARRIIEATNDGGRWVFDEFGEPFAFEDVTAYKRRRVADRFTPEMLERYLVELGVPVGEVPDVENALLVRKRPDAAESG